MKKLLIVLLAAMMVLSLAAVSMAAPTVGGELKYILKIADEATDDNNDENDMTDAAEAKVTFTTAVSDTVTAFVAVKTGDGANGGFKADEYYMNFTQDFGTVKMGYFGHKLTPSLDIIKGFGNVDMGIKELKANVLTVANFNVTDNFVIGLAYALDGDGAAWVDDDSDPLTDDVLVGGFGDIKPLYDGAYDVKFGYATDLFGGEVHVFSNGDCVAVEDDIESATALDVWYKPVDMAKVYLAYVDAELYKFDGDIDPSMILGVYADLTDAFFARFEYNLEDYDAESANYGVKLGYKFANGVTGEFKAEQKADDTMPMEVSMKVAF